MTCPEWWPLPDGQEIGVHAQELVAYLKVAAPPAIEVAKHYLGKRHPNTPVTVRAYRASQLAKLKLTPDSSDVCIGTMAVGEAGTLAAQAMILMDRAGIVRVCFVAKRGEPTWIMSAGRG